MKDRFRNAMASRLGEVLTPEVAAWLETHCFAHEIGFAASTGILADTEMAGLLERLEREMLGLPQVECPVREHFAPGLYAREITIPRGTVLIGAVHRTQNMAVLSRGRLRLVTETGTTEISAHHVLTVNPGGKNAAVALEDAIWTNYFPTTETDPDRLIESLVEARRDELLGGSRNRQLLTYAERMQELEV